MELKFIRNIQFTKLIKAEGRIREINFRKPNGHEESLTTVDVSDDRGVRIIFTMKKENSAWRIVPQTLPAWVSQLEDKLSELIEEELKSYE